MSERDLDGKVALVTGSSSGIGRAIAEALADRGAAVVVHGIDQAQNMQVLNEWRAANWRAIDSDADLSTPDGAACLMETVRTSLGEPDILVLNASIELPETLPNLTPDAMAAQTAINISANCLLLQACVPHMTSTGWGRVVAIGSVQEVRPNARHLFYASTKAALTNVILNLARSDSSTGLTFNIVRPGAILTNRNCAVLADPSYERVVIARIPAGRLGAAADCSGIVSLLCSNAGSYINGAVISVDGGMQL